MKSRRIDKPEPCFRKMTEVKGGPWVPARIHRTCHCTIHGSDDNLPHEQRATCDRSRPLLAEKNGRPVKDVYHVWHAREEIDEAEYRFLVDDCEHARLHRPDDPKANPYKPLDFMTMPPPPE